MSLFKAANRLFKAPNRFVSLIHSFSFWSSPLGFSLLSSRFFSGSSHSTFMEVVIATLKNASSSYDSVVISAENKRYSYAHLISSAWSICTDLANGNFKSNIEESKFENSIKTNNKVDNLLGARVGIVAKPSAEFVAGVLGIWLCGGVAVPLAVSYPVTELLYVMNDSDISLVLSTQEHQEIMEKVASDCSSNFSLLPSVTRVPANTALPESFASEFHLIFKLIEEMLDSRKAEGDEPALILYTSGTTGKPKGVVHTHKGIISQVQILTEAWEYTSSDHFLHCLPLHHVHGLFNALLAPIYAGAVVEFMPKFSVRGVWQRWRESYPDNGSKVDHAITVFTGVPTMYSRLLQGYETMDSDLKTASASAARQLRLMMCGSSALPYPIMKQWEDVTGHRLLERYGMTEFVMALSNPLHGTRKAGTVGKPLPQVEVKIVGEDGTSTGGVGELCVRSPSLFKEYWRQPKVTNESFTDDGFFKTGDTVTVDQDGYFVILGRSNADIMKVGGYKLSALEIEAVLLEHPAVSECCVVGLQDNNYGEIVCVIIIINADLKKIADHQLKPAITLEELQEWAKEKLAPYKIPTKLFLWDTLPRNAMGKVNKKEIRRLLES